VDEYKVRIELILRSNNDLIRLKCISGCPENVLQINIIKDRMKIAVQQLMNLRKDLLQF